jgi:tetratricopeptide (TPR) repeat protein
MFLLGLTWRALGDEQRAAPALAASGRSEDKAPAASGRSADPALTAKLLRKSGDWREEAQLLEGQKQTRNAARLHERHQSHQEAVRLYEQAGDLLSALRSALTAKDSVSGKRLLKKIPIDAAKPVLEKAKGHDWLMEHYVEAGDFQSVARLYERARQFDQAALAWERGGSVSNARKAYESAKDSANAQRVRALEVEELARRGDRLGAATLLMGEGRKDQAVEILLGLPAPKAFRFLQKLKLDEEAMALARKQIQEAESKQKPSEAARWLEWVGDFPAAAQAWEKADRKDKALAMYEQVGQWQRAGELAEALGQKEKAVDFYNRAGDKAAAERVRASAPLTEGYKAEPQPVEEAVKPA